MRRRESIALVGGASVSFSVGGSAQEILRVPRIGVLWIGTKTTAAIYLDALRRGLRDLGYEEDRNLEIEQRYADGNAERLPILVGELIAAKVNVIVTASIPFALATMNAAANIPIVVAAAGDFVGNGLAASMERPGGTITGIDEVVPGLSAKRLELLIEAVGVKSPVAVLSSATGPTHAKQMQETEEVARSLGVTLKTVRIGNANEIEPAFEEMTRERATALLVFSGVLTAIHSSTIAGLAAKNRLPGMYWHVRFVTDGGLMSYGPNLPRMFRQSAALVDRILKGATPADVPVEYATDFELIINLTAAKALGLQISPTLLARADRVID
ncbi:ABC transporter substrate-binding protein [Bradyrhizobium sp. NAS80.1]|uniref:ABC transporter substrate-binding protein n=1 Tax=Bradyrhizobium sp. NAS80.1 TaxID=1680159 RepID=UPI000A034BDF|nr:ABC transporter substrate-binding protein [Bradyrhizobium sp. NAS80.1]